jgi:hypothetical protein
MDVREVRVSFRKTVGDGNYGNETVEVGLTAAPDPGLSVEEATRVLAIEARDAVVGQLARSTNETVRDALLTPEEREARWRAARRARREATAAWEAERRADHPMLEAMEDALDAADEETP